MIVALYAAGAFLSGSFMFSYWIGRLLRRNITSVGDGNPGAINLWKTSGMKFGLLGIALDFLKGYVPVLLALQDVDGYALAPIALAAIAGHAFSPFLKGKGGKAIAVSFGVWSALTSFEASLAYAIVMAAMTLSRRVASSRWRSSARTDALQVVFGMLLVGGYLALRGFAEPVLWTWAGSFALLAYTHRAELTGLASKSASG
ncbi:glycerol-3-phosphate acyltransferase [Cohnella sp. GCM10027633]|uniref:glycerol-3-phosphate acyltransferase n=1 Tax=unclassified Cohnella TaxID=2636738 RepID=UPI00363037FF